MTDESADQGTAAPRSRPTTPDPLSVLGQLEDRRAQIVSEQVLPLPVPRWDNPEMVVKYTTLEHPAIRSKLDRIDKAAAKDKGRVEVEAHSDLLIAACTAVVARIDGREYSLRPGDRDGDPTTFDPDLAAAFGMDKDATARAVVKRLYLTDGDILSAGRAVAEFSGYREQAADEEVMGE